MKNKYGIGSLVSYKNLIWKIVEVWDVGFIASVTGKIQGDNKYVVTNIPEQKVMVVNESEIEVVNGPDLEKSQGLQSLAKTEVPNKKGK